MKIFLLKETNAYYDCSKESYNIGTVPKGFISEYTEYLNGWYRINNDNIWIYCKDDYTGEYIVREVKDAKDQGKIKFDEEKIKKFDLSLQRFAEIEGTKTDTGSSSSFSTVVDSLVQDGILSAWTTASNDAQALELSFNSACAMMGMPYQFLPWVDRRVTGNKNVMADIKYIGRKYAEKIAIRSPMLVLQPGKAHFMAGASNEEKEGVLGALAGDQDSVNNVLADETANPHRYYSFALDHMNYNKYVNTLCWACAANLNLRNTTYNAVGDNGRTMSINKFMGRDIDDNVDGVYTFSEAFTSTLKYTGAIAFYINSDSQISENITTTTGQSQLAEKVNGISDIAREIQFVLGTNGRVADVVSGMGKLGANGLETAISGLASSFTGSGSLLSTIGESIGTIIAGGKMIFPEIWQDTQFSRSYSIDIKLVSPDNDDFSIYHNILVPLMHLIALALPKGTSSNSYMSPFLIRAAYKSFMNIDMGMIVDMSINRGAEGCWNRHGVPTVVDVSMTIKDLYPVLNLASYPGVWRSDDSYDILKNDALLAYIANLCGVNVVNSDVTRAITFAAIMRSKGFTNIPNAILDSTWDKLITVSNNLLGKYGL